MDILRSQRRPKRSLATKAMNLLDVLIATANPDLPKIQGNIEFLGKTQQQLDELDRQIITLMIEGAEEADAIDKEAEEAAEYERRFLELKMKANTLQPAQVAASSSSSDLETAFEGQRHRFKLPELQLKKFSGDLKDWITFWSQFSKIDQDHSLHATDKFQYLLQAMEAGTEARELVASYPQSEENYPKVIASLKRRYGNEDLLLQVYIRELLNLVICNVTAEEKIPFESLYLKIESHLRALKTLKLEKADPASWLFPLVESSLPEEILIAWQRSDLSTKDGKMEKPPKNRLDFMMEFLNQEVEIRQKIEIAKTSFQAKEVEHRKSSTEKKGKSSKSSVPTLAGFHNGDARTCLFCSKSHESKDCFSAQSWSLEEKRKILKEKRCCFVCFRTNHQSKQCKAQVRCNVCGRKHHVLMCPDLEGKRSEGRGKDSKSEGKETETLVGMSDVLCDGAVPLQTLMVIAHGPKTNNYVRVFLDSGAQRSHILKDTASKLKLLRKDEAVVRHQVFGGNTSSPIRHGIYDVKLERLDGTYSCKLEVRDHGRISNSIPKISRSTPNLFRDLEKNDIKLTDVGEESAPIEILLGNDVFGRLITGKKVNLSCGLQALETKLGWVLSGGKNIPFTESIAMSVLSMNSEEGSMIKLWDLDQLGITDPFEVKSTEQKEKEARDKLLETIKRKEDGRYQVQLPWKDGHPELTTNKKEAERRLKRTIEKLEVKGQLPMYHQIFMDWLQEGFIERIPEVNFGNGHVLCHRPHFKPDSLTTPVRPVFDASCKVGKAPSLNDCLHTGISNIQLIPDIILRFREHAVGVVSDIRKAFQMIEVRLEDRDVMRFLWFNNLEEKKIVEYRHARVMFGATCSPFILGTVLEYHLQNVKEDDKLIAEQLMDSLYVDNCVVSLKSKEEYLQFKEKSTALLLEAQMDLRLWQSNVDEMGKEESVVSVLGIQWDRKSDELFVETQKIAVPEKITKRSLLSTAHRVFDPIGILSPALIPIKISLREAWVNKKKWDEELPDKVKLEFLEWHSQLEDLRKIRIPRKMARGNGEREKWSLHIFTDGSKLAFSCVVFLRVEQLSGAVSVQLIAAKSRITPVKLMTIPRVELMGCLIGSRLARSVRRALKLEEVPEYFWSDSTTALAWITREDPWGTFVGRRVQEIRGNSNPDSWNFIPGTMNPADLPSRGCMPAKLLESKWWEGPAFLKKDFSHMLKEKGIADESIVEEERRRTPPVEATMMIWDEVRNERTFSAHVRIMGYVLRFIHNLKAKKSGLPVIKHLYLTIDELKLAERKLIQHVQLEAFPEDNVAGVKTFIDPDGVLRVKTRLVYREDLVDFKFPVVLPRKHVLVDKMIQEYHRTYGHAGVAFLMCKIREKYWILQSRRAIQNIVKKCTRCRRYSAKPTVTEEAPLPLDRIKDAEVFQVVGVDMAGPLILKNGNKVWIAIFTCAIFRAAHLEVCPSLSTRTFLKALKNFIMKYRRPEVIYSDNGTNFVGTSNHFKTMDWEWIQKQEGVNMIQWKFNPPSASWWGGFWERLVRSMKDIMKRMLGKASITKEELLTTLKTVEEVMNGRPLTYVSDDPDDLQPLTPSLFLNMNGPAKFPEGELSTSEKLRVRFKCTETLKEELKNRFRREYLSQLIFKRKGRPTRPLRVGEIVIVGSDNRKRIDWPLARILELYSGKDQICRVAKIQTKDGVFKRPVQRLFSLEVDEFFEEDKEYGEKVLKTRSGRIVRKTN